MTDSPPTRRRRRRAAPASDDDGSADAKAITDAPTPTRRTRPVSKAEATAAAEEFEKDQGAKKRTSSGPPKVRPKTKQDKEPAGSPSPFATAPHQTGFPKPADMRRGFQTVVTNLFDSGYDVEQEWEAIRGGLEITDALTPQRLQRAANGQERLAERAHQLYIVGKVEVSAYMRETESTHGAIRDAAIQKLEKDKATGARTKQITDADVKAEAARLYPDEWSDICTRRERAEAMLSQLMRVSELAKSRCYTVSNMMSPGARGV